MHINVWLLPIVITVIPIILIYFGSSYSRTPNTFYYDQLEDNWLVKCGDMELTDAALSEINLGHIKKGDKLVISNNIPTAPIPSGAIMFRSILSMVTVKIDDKVVYEYGRNYYENNELLPKYYHFIPISRADASSGKTIEITFTVSADNAFSGISPVYYGNRVDLERNFVQSKRLSFFIGIFLCMFSFILLTLSSYLFIYHKRDLSLLFSSFISFCFGAYTLSFNDVFNFIAHRDYFFTLLEYISLYCIPLSIIAFLVSSHPQLNGKAEKVMLIVNSLFPVITLILHLFNIAHINKFVFVLHIIAIIEGVIMIPRLSTNMLKKYREFHKELGYSGLTSDSILLLGLIIFIAGAVIDILKYNFFRLFTAGGEAYSSINFANIGALCFVICLFVYYFFHGIEHINDEYTREHLEGLAYTDALTGLMNRAKCMQYMASLNGNYAVISLDLDNLKPINDTLGHIEGDRMISSFANIMKRSFVGAQLIGRTGGDEFIVAIENPAPDTCDIMLQNMEERIAEFNKNDKTINLSSSYGYAYSTEVKSKNANDVFMLADSRMYKVKEEHHKQKISRFMSDIFDSEKIEGGKTVL